MMAVASSMGQFQAERLLGLCRGLQSALAGLRGTGPLVSVTLEVIGDTSRDGGEASTSAQACQCSQSGLPPRPPGSTRQFSVLAAHLVAISAQMGHPFAEAHLFSDFILMSEHSCVMFEAAMAFPDHEALFRLF